VKAAAAAALIQRIERLVYSNIVSADNRAGAFERLFRSYGTWSHFRTNEADAALRETEQRFLRRMLDSSGAAWHRYMAALQTSDGFEHKELEEFVEAAKQGFVENACQVALNVFRAHDGAFKLLKGEVPEMSQALILNAQSPLWTGEQGAAPMERLLGDAENSPEIQRNAHHLLDMATGRHQVHISVRADELREFLRNERPAVALWTAAISSPIQFRMLMTTRTIREVLVACGIGEDRLAYPDWLRAGEERKQRGKTP
jgi:hypothetical protein